MARRSTPCASSARRRYMSASAIHRASPTGQRRSSVPRSPANAFSCHSAPESSRLISARDLLVPSIAFMAPLMSPAIAAAPPGALLAFAPRTLQRPPPALESPRILLIADRGALPVRFARLVPGELAEPLLRGVASLVVPQFRGYVFEPAADDLPARLLS